MNFEFYDKTPLETLRFGDVIRGYPSVFAAIDTGSPTCFQNGVALIVDNQAYGVVLNPCCSIRDEKLSVAILKPIKKKYHRIQKLKENPLLLNAPMLAKDAMPSQQWEKLSEEEKNEKEQSGLGFVFNTVFAYASHPLLPEYMLDGESKSNQYEIDFRETSTIHSKNIKKPEELINNVFKILQLSDQSRELLRIKLIAYFNRNP